MREVLPIWHTKRDLGIPYENCPYCGEKITPNESGEYHCDFCDRDFDEDDMEHEELRHVLSSFIHGRTEETAVECYIEVNPENEQGGETLLIDKIFELVSEGTQWAHFYGTPEDDWYDIDYFTNEALKEIADYFMNWFGN